ncbi:RNA 2',3'-cyclic phosphodiesterase [Horticoccus sp. 23ND18S-11]|uniref:RNA 2',3'-cyclic phosphodiesterase n=1 Tax=Horticoccus sp. 23ND18S-11 TaxID=3391832 RepID=UPI0039C96DF2
METERLFVALTLPAPVRAVLAGFARPLTGVTWTPPAQLHVTLRFLGDVATDALPPLMERLAKIRVAPFVLSIEGAGSFPPNRPPRTLWVGVGSGHPRLFQLRQRLDDALLASGLQLDLRTFQPHVTLARATEVPDCGATPWLNQHRQIAAPPFLVEAFDLYASELRPEGALHTLKRSFPLAK